MAKDFKFEKRAIIFGASLLLLADVALGIYSWRRSKSPALTVQELNTQAGKLKKLKAEIEAAEKTAANLPKTVQDCDKFEQSLPSVNTVSSAIASDMAEIAKKAGTQLTGVAFRDKEKSKDPGAAGIAERSIDATVSGPYDAVVKFLNGLQKSQNFYVVDSLDLATETSAPNLLRVAVHMRAFFRTAGT